MGNELNILHIAYLITDRAHEFTKFCSDGASLFLSNHCITISISEKSLWVALYYFFIRIYVLVPSSVITKNASCENA